MADQIPTDQIRRSLSEIGKLYDPNGFISPVVIIAEILIQELWKTHTDWDEEITGTIAEQWAEFRNHLSDIGRIRIQRWLGTSLHSKMQLHGFSDASQTAYACCIYVRTENSNGSITVQLIQSKTRVAPLKTLSIPRLELCGAHLLAKLLKTIIRYINVPIEQSFCWTDSEVVLQWTLKEPSVLKTFVSNRVAYIQDNTQEKGIPWHWVSGIENPADIASRGMIPATLINNQLWWHGPEWLNNHEDSWPIKRPQTIPDLELTKAEVKTISMVTINAPILLSSAH